LCTHAGVRILSEQDLGDLTSIPSKVSQIFSAHPCVVVAAAADAPDDAARLPIANDVAGRAETVLTAARMQGYVCAGVVATGSFTAERVAKALGADVLEPLGEPIPLCAIGRVSGGQWTGLRLALKGGLIGGQGALTDLVGHLLATDISLQGLPEPALGPLASDPGAQRGGAFRSGPR
jgi:uncharacterized protein YgbK (DUF1537 family)